MNWALAVAAVIVAGFAAPTTIVILVAIAAFTLAAIAPKPPRRNP